MLDRPDGRRRAATTRSSSAVRRGDDRAFEELYARYQRRIAAYVFGMVKDHGRAEDITQEVFVSALRRMRETERPIAFKPWVYEIAKNACIDAYRRRRRAEEVSFDADDRLLAADHGAARGHRRRSRTPRSTPSRSSTTRGAFGGLSDSHHQILVMRELEGLQLQGHRRAHGDEPARASRARCSARASASARSTTSSRRARAACASRRSSPTQAGRRSACATARRLARHVSHCQPCRRLAAHAGLDIQLPARTRVADKIAAWLPLPAFLRLRRGGDEVASSAAGGSGHGGWLAHAPAFADSLGTGWGKAAAGLVALLLAGAGAGVSGKLGGAEGDQRVADPKPAAERSAPLDGGAAPVVAPARARDRAGTGERRSSGVVGGRQGGKRSRGASESLGRDGGGGAGRAVTPPGDATPATGGGDAGSSPRGGEQSGDGGGGRKTAADGPVPKLPAVDPPSVPTSGGGGPVDETVDNVNQTVQNAGQNVQNTADNAVQNLNTTLNDPANLVPNVTNTANDAVQDVGTTVGGAVDDVTNTVGGLLKKP